MKSWILALVAGVLLAAPAAAQRTQRISNGWGWAGIAASTLDSQATPAPSPTPKPGDVCKQCKGSGKVGDGVVFSTCRECNGTGKVVGQKVSELLEAVAEKLVSAPSPSDRVVRSSSPAFQDCPGGVCNLPAVRSEPIAVSECQNGICPAPVKSSTVRYTQPQQQMVRKGWLFRR